MEPTYAQPEVEMGVVQGRGEGRERKETENRLTRKGLGRGLCRLHSMMECHLSWANFNIWVASLSMRLATPGVR